MDIDDKDLNKITLAWLNSANGISNRKIDKTIKYFKTTENIWYNFNDEVKNLNFLSDEVKSYLLNTKKTFKKKLSKIINKNNISIITIYDKEYPEKLRNINNPPYILYIKGNLDVLNKTSIAIVGSRKATSYGKWVAEKLTKELALLGVVIVSGLAVGIDTIAHKTAIKNGTKTIAVLGNGINTVYPKKNSTLYNEIINNGLITTEYSFGMIPLAKNFPNRNRIISGLCEGVVIVEAMKKSGTLITASHAANQGREVFAVPGNIDSLYSKGTNELIKDGAKITTSVEDIIEEINSLKLLRTTSNEININKLNDDEKTIIETLMNGSKTIFDISNSTDLQISDIFCILTTLEMKGFIKQVQGKKFMLAN